MSFGDDYFYRTGVWHRQDNAKSEIMELVGARIRRGRQQAGWSQRRIAQRAGVSQSEVSRLERGMGAGISAYRLVAIAMAIGDQFPFGFCSHLHSCAFPFDPRRRTANTMESRDTTHHLIGTP